MRGARRGISAAVATSMPWGGTIAAVVGRRWRPRVGQNRSRPDYFFCCPEPLTRAALVEPQHCCRGGSLRSAPPLPVGEGKTCSAAGRFVPLPPGPTGRGLQQSDRPPSAAPVTGSAPLL